MSMIRGFLAPSVNRLFFRQRIWKVRGFDLLGSGEVCSLQAPPLRAAGQRSPWQDAAETKTGPSWKAVLGKSAMLKCGCKYLATQVPSAALFTKARTRQLHGQRSGLVK